MHVVVTPTAGLVEPGNTRQRNVPAKRRRHGPVQQAAAGTAIVSGEVPDGNGMMWARRVENHKVLLPSRGSYSNLHPRSGRSRKNSTSCCLSPPPKGQQQERGAVTTETRAAAKGKKKQQQDQQLHQKNKQTQKQQQQLQKTQQQKQRKQSADLNMEVEEMPPSRSDSLKRGRVEQEDIPTEKRDERGRKEKDIDRARSQSVPASPAESEKYPQIKEPSPFTSVPHSLHILPGFNFYTSSSIHFFLAPPSQGEEKEKYFPGLEEICKQNRVGQGLVQSQKSFLGTLCKLSAINGKSVEDSLNFPQAPGVITFIRDTEIPESAVPLRRS